MPSASEAWAVGDFANNGGDRTLILHWDGTAWIRVNSPHPGVNNDLTAVAASSASNAWAVGNFFPAGQSVPLALHCS